MKITNINIPAKKEHNDGLEDIKMDRLGSVVLIAGKNGSGKSRILNKIAVYLNVKPKPSEIKETEAEIDNLKNSIDELRNRISNRQTDLNMIGSDDIMKDRINQAIESHLSAIAKHKIEIAKYENHVNWDIIVSDEPSENYSAIKFVPKDLLLADSNNYSKQQLKTFSKNIDFIGFDHIPKGAFAKIQLLQDRWFNATHQSSSLPIGEKESIIVDYIRLKELIFVFLNTALDRNSDGDATLFKFPVGEAHLSDGQKVLLQYCMAIYSQETALKDLIIIMDEPENHLHPSIIIETISRLQSHVSNGQIWIATHSIPLLAHFDPSLIWFVENGNIKHAGKIPEKVLQSLLGDESEISKLQDFIGLPAQYATTQYAFESLFEPKVVITDSNDPQTFQIREGLMGIGSSQKLRVLDYGAGKGRLILSIAELDKNSEKKLIDKLDYIAYDKFEEDKPHCENALTIAYKTNNKRYYNDFQRLLSDYDKVSFDVVIMCNVLHEIDPKEWLQLFKPNGTITSLLKENGKLLLVEDHQIPVGEKAYQKGFLVLDTPQLKELFKISESEKEFTCDNKREGRLKAHLIPKKCLVNIDEKTRIAAIKDVLNTAHNKIIDIRNKDRNYQNGKIHGFWTQQLANAQLNLTELTT